MPSEQTGARFFDDQRQDRGWAPKVVRKVRILGGLTILDVVTNEASLANFLRTLDRAPLSVQHTDSEGDSYTFAWASGYENGSAIRIQGMLQPGG